MLEKGALEVVENPGTGHYSQIHPALQQIPATALLSFACDWLALARDISFGRLSSPNVWRYIPIES